MPRLIPMLLVRDKGLVKTTKFKDEKYVGDPINAVRIFNEKCVDEITVLDIDATVKGKDPDFEMIENLAAECRMPLCYGENIFKCRCHSKSQFNKGNFRKSWSSKCRRDP